MTHQLSKWNRPSTEVSSSERSFLHVMHSLHTLRRRSTYRYHNLHATVHEARMYASVPALVAHTQAEVADMTCKTQLIHLLRKMRCSRHHMFVVMALPNAAFAAGSSVYMHTAGLLRDTFTSYIPSKQVITQKSTVRRSHFCTKIKYGINQVELCPTSI